MKKGDNPKRQAILDAARRVFMAEGYAGASMEAIADAAPVSKPTLYAHFDNKQTLFAAVIFAQCEVLLSRMSQAGTVALDPVAGLKAIARAFVDVVYAPDSLGLYRLLIGEQHHFPALGEQVYRSSAEPAVAQVSAYLTELAGRRLIRVTDAESSSRLLLGLLQGVPHFRCLLGLQPGLSETEKQHLIDSAVDLFVRGHELPI